MACSSSRSLSLVVPLWLLFLLGLGVLFVLYDLYTSHSLMPDLWQGLPRPHRSHQPSADTPLNVLKCRLIWSYSYSNRRTKTTSSYISFSYHKLCLWRETLSLEQERVALKVAMKRIFFFFAIFENFKFEMHNSKVLEPYNENWRCYGLSNLGHFP